MRTSPVSPMGALARLREVLPPVALWIAGVGGAGLLLGPALLPGPLLSLDLVTPPRIPFPDAVLGLGPELPRRVPLGAVLSWLSRGLGGALTIKLLLLGCLSAAFVGASRLARGAPLPARLVAGTLYALGPFAASRTAAGHWALVATMAVLPFALPHLLTPGRHLARTFLGLAALSVTGVFGGLVGGGVALVSCGLERPRRTLRVLGLVLVAQLPWLVPGLLVRGGGMRLAGGRHFAPDASGPLGVVGALPAQHGFWRGASQVGGRASTGVVLLGIGLALLALVGHRDFPAAWRRPLAVVAVIGFALAAAPATPGLDAVHARVTEWAPLAPLRETHRALILFLVWMAPATALGVVAVARAEAGLAVAAPAFALAGALVLAWPGVLGIEGRLEPASWPDDWSRAAETVSERPGTVLALPWHQYLNLGFAGDRRVLNPVPDYFGGDVVSSHDPALAATPYQESTDWREGTVRALLPSLREGRPVGADLAAIDVRWVVVLHAADWHDYAPLSRDPNLSPAIRGSTLDLYEVEGSRPEAVLPDPAGGRWRIPVTLTAHALFAGAVLFAWRGRREVQSRSAE